MNVCAWCGILLHPLDNVRFVSFSPLLARDDRTLVHACCETPYFSFMENV